MSFDRRYFTFCLLCVNYVVYNDIHPYIASMESLKFFAFYPVSIPLKIFYIIKTCLIKPCNLSLELSDIKIWPFVNQPFIHVSLGTKNLTFFNIIYIYVLYIGTYYISIFYFSIKYRYFLQPCLPLYWTIFCEDTFPIFNPLSPAICGHLTWFAAMTLRSSQL